MGYVSCASKKGNSPAGARPGAAGPASVVYDKKSAFLIAVYVDAIELEAHLA
mgnify:CR=1 FL=1